jgi:hypothetical protein
MTRIFLAGLLGGIAMFIWSSIAHMVLPLGETGLSEIPNEQTILDAMQHNIAEKSGLYIFPGFGLGPNPTREQKNEAMKHMADNFARRPSGILMYNAAGSRPIDMVRWLGVEFLTEVAEALLAVYLLSKTRLTNFGARLGFMIGAGILAAIATNISYWNWYGFPTSYTLSYVSTQVVGFLCAGLVAAFVLRKQTFGAN